MTSLFALTISNVFIINMWASSIGTNSASNFAVLKDIFELNMKLKLFNKNEAKKFLFLIKDFKKRGNNEELTRAKLEQDMKRIWSECEMPDKYKDRHPADVFKFEFAFFPDFFYEREEFDEQVKKLKARFDRNAPNTLFEDGERLPIDGLPELV